MPVELKLDLKGSQQWLAAWMRYCADHSMRPFGSEHDESRNCFEDAWGEGFLYGARQTLAAVNWLKDHPCLSGDCAHTGHACCVDQLEDDITESLFAAKKGLPHADDEGSEAEAADSDPKPEAEGTR